MPKTSNKKRNIILAIAVLIVILAAFFAFDYFRNKEESVSQENQITGEVKKNQNAGQLELSPAAGKEILELLLVLQKIKLDISFFQDQNFMRLIDFYKKIEILEEEKGNPNPFKKI